MKNDYVIIGKLGSVYGVHGWIRIHAYTVTHTDIFNYHPWLLKKKNSHDWLNMKLEDHAIQPNQMLAKFFGIDTPEQAREWTNALIGVAHSQLPALNDDEYYWSDLVGMTVINQKNEILGKVAYLLETGSNDVLVVKGDKEHALPWLLHTVIMRVDKTTNIIYVNWELV